MRIFVNLCVRIFDEDSKVYLIESLELVDDGDDSLDGDDADLLRLERGVDADAEPGGGARDELAESGRIVVDGRGGGGAGVGALLLALGWRRDTLRRIEH